MSGALPTVLRFAWAQAYPTRPVRILVGFPPGSARSQMQKSPAGKFHFEPPSRFTSLDHLVGADQQRERYGTPSVFAR